ncbi:MAG TPA: 2'-5' RNA ligase family protein [Chitinophagaceae bacterium]|nr:2'-5' RNA ligase family protein [Chitinophagaceae bacterium]
MENGWVSTPSAHEGLWEYLLIIRPDAEVCNKLALEKQDFYNRYQHKSAIQLKPHITVGAFLALEGMENTIIKWMQRICSMHQSFRVTLNNYSGFPEHTIYLRVQNHAPFKELAFRLKVIDNYIKSNNCPSLKLAARPYLSLASNLPPKLYGEAMREYSRKTFHETFIVTELLLLKRMNEYDACRHVNVFRFYPPDTNSYNQVA